MNAASTVLRDAMQAFVNGFTKDARAVDANGLREQLAKVFPAAAPIDRQMVRRMLRAVGFVASQNPHDPAGIWCRVVRPEEVPY